MFGAAPHGRLLCPLVPHERKILMATKRIKKVIDVDVE